MENEELEHELIIDETELEEAGVIEQNDDDDITTVEETIDEAGFSLAVIEKIHSMFDSGNTKTTIAKELKIDRSDVITVLDSYIGRRRINGTPTPLKDFKFDPKGRVRIELGDRLNTSIYVKSDATEADIKAIKAKWMKIINNE